MLRSTRRLSRLARPVLIAVILLSGCTLPPPPSAATIREMMGNLCVLPQDELGNAPFDEKRKAYARFRSRFANEIAKYKGWSPDTVRDRTRRITDATLKFLNLEVSAT